MQHHRDLLHHLRRKLLHLRQAFHRLPAHLLGQQHQHRARCLRGQVRQYQRDRLRVLSLNEFRQLLRIRFLQRIEVLYAQFLRAGHFIDQCASFDFPKRFYQQPVCVVRPSLRQVLLR